MKPCSGNRKSIALLAANALDAPAAGKLRQHIATCPGCQEYFGEISGVASRVSRTHEASEIEASERFHRRLAGRIRETEKKPPADQAATYLELMKWRLLIPFGAICLVFGIVVGRFYHPNRIHTTPSGVTPASAAAADAGDISPTLANYQNAANRSFDQLDALLSRQAGEGLPPAPIYHASATSLAQEPL